MNKYSIIAITLIVLIGGGLFFATNNSGTNEKTQKPSGAAMERIETQKSSPQSLSLDQNSKYVEYSKEILERARGARRVLYFYASWCPTCRSADADFKAKVDTFPEDLVLSRVNYNDPETDQEEKDLAKKYAVTYQHTFVQIDSAGKEVAKWNGGQTEELLENLK